VSQIHVDGLLADAAVLQAPNLRVAGLLAEAPTLQTPHLRVDGLLADAAVLQSAHLRVAGLLLEAYVTDLPEDQVTAVFPAAILARAGWELHRRPTWSGRVAAPVSGREVLTPYYQYPLREFELTFEGLLSGASMGVIPAQSKQLLDGFFSTVNGPYGRFLFADPEDSSVTGGVIATAPGGVAAFPIVRVLNGGYAEPVGQVNAIQNVYLNGVAQAAGSWSVVLPNTLVLGSSPAAGVTITADFTFYWVCRFLEDQTDFGEFARNFHAVKSLRFRTVKP
jgi:hypothetical protein